MLIKDTNKEFPKDFYGDRLRLPIKSRELGMKMAKAALFGMSS